jgi:hypothetical protein
MQFSWIETRIESREDRVANALLKKKKSRRQQQPWVAVLLRSVGVLSVKRQCSAVLFFHRAHSAAQHLIQILVLRSIVYRLFLVV